MGYALYYSDAAFFKTTVDNNWLSFSEILLSLYSSMAIHIYFTPENDL
jgi:hypothetical protein